MLIGLTHAVRTEGDSFGTNISALACLNRLDDVRESLFIALLL